MDNDLREVSFTEMKHGSKEEYEFLTPLFQEHQRQTLADEVLAMLMKLQGPKLGYKVDRYEHSLQTATRAERDGADTETIVAALLHDLGKGSTPVEEWPRHIGHEHRGAPLVNLVSRRLRVPNEWNLLAQHVARLHLDCHRQQSGILQRDGAPPGAHPA